MTARGSKKAPRVTKTPAQRAQEALDVAQRSVTRLEARKSVAEKELADINAELEPAVRRRDYLAQHPDLPEVSS